ncbi:MAG TPA: bifunctional nuclease family protein [Bdellovibrionota bacterium]|nr:bifunctional nuclease family protein [Bdellovibrionota bacterium]
MFIEMNVFGLALDPASNTPMVILKDTEQKKSIPIWIGLFEASAIASQLEKVQLTRPMTHDLLRNIVGELGATLVRVEINDLKENTYFAILVVRKASNEEIRIDARPSDAIALALRCQAPILVDEDVIERSGRSQKVPEGTVSPQDKEKWAEILKNLSDEAFGKYKM